MKYFDKLPKRTYETTLGSFSISDYFSYYKFNFDLISKRQFEFDSKTTLVEAASSLYEDPNSFWLILLANETINPFLLFVDNYTNYIQNNQNKVTSIIANVTDATNVGTYMASGSLVTLQSLTGGNPYDFSYVGNFDLDGQIYIVEEQNSYTKRITVKPTPNNTPIPIVNLNAVQYIDLTLPSEWELSANTNVFLANDVEPYLEATEAILDSGPVGSISFRNMQIADIPPVYTSSGSQQTEQTFQEVSENANRKVNIFNPSELSKVTNRLITIKYT
jgi:hypothetical protein